MLRRLFRGGRRLAVTVRLSVLVTALTVAPGWVSAEEAENGPRLEGLKRLDLPPEIARAADVRWLTDGEIILGVIGPGIHAWRIGESGAEFRVALEQPEGELLEIGGRSFVARSPERDYGRLAVSRQRIAFADLFGGIHFAHEDGISGPVDIEFLGDLDRKGPRTAAVGLMRKGAGVWAPFVAWLLEDAGGPPRGLLPTRDGGGGLEACHAAELSVIRFIADDRLLVLPGAEPGVFVYDGQGRLRDSLDAEVFFAEAGCDVELSERARSPLSDAYVRAEWLGQRRVIDEVVADGEGNVYFFVRYAAGGPATDRVDASGSPFEVQRRPVGAGIAATLPNTDPDCSVPLCYEPAVPGRAFAGGIHDWRPVASARLGGSEQRWRHHVALSSDAGAVGLATLRPPGSSRPRRLRSQEPDSRPGRVRASTVAVRAGSVTDRVVASVPPPRGRVCWDLVHARGDDLRAVTRQPCAVEAEFADTRLRADLRGDRVIILLRGGALRGGDVRAAEAFEARLLPPAGSGD